MPIKNVLKVGALCGVMLLAGCASSVTAPAQYSGFLKDYSGLQEVTTASGKKAMRWTAPGFDPAQYDSLVFNPIQYYPQPKATTQIGNTVLEDIRQYANNHLKAAAAQKIKIVTTPGPKTLIFHGAITGVDTGKQGLQFYEVIPVAMVVAGTQALTGHRTMDTDLYFEGELVDAATNKVVLKVVRKGEGQTLANENTPLTLQTIKPVIDNMSTDITMFEVK